MHKIVGQKWCFIQILEKKKIRKEYAMFWLIPLVFESLKSYINKENVLKAFYMDFSLKLAFRGSHA